MIKLIEMLKAGEVSDIDYKNGKARVLLLGDDNKTTDWLNIIVPFSKSHRDNYTLGIGQTVYCLFFSEMPEQGVIIGCPMRGGIKNENEIRRTFSDGNSWSYDNGILILNIPKIIIDGDLNISGTTVTGGSIDLNKHTHSGVTQGGDKTGGPQ